MILNSDQNHVMLQTSQLDQPFRYPYPRLLVHLHSLRLPVEQSEIIPYICLPRGKPSHLLSQRLKSLKRIQSQTAFIPRSQVQLF